MSETPTKKPVCSECGAEALGKALFCFDCGASLELPAEDENLVTGSEEENENPDQITDKPIAPPVGDPFDESGEDGPEAESIPTGTPVKSATAIRKNPGVMRMKRIETRWLPEDGSPNLWFILGTVVLGLAALLVFYLSLYLR